MPGISRQLRLVDQSLQSELIPTLTGRPPPSELDRKLFALPARLGGLGIGIPSKNSDREFLASTTICKPLIDQILKQNEDYSYEVLADQMTSKASVQKQNRERSTSDADDLAAHLPNDLKRAMSLARENGASV